MKWLMCVTGSNFGSFAKRNTNRFGSKEETTAISSFIPITSAIWRNSSQRSRNRRRTDTAVHGGAPIITSNHQGGAPTCSRHREKAQIDERNRGKAPKNWKRNRLMWRSLRRWGCRLIRWRDREEVLMWMWLRRRERVWMFNSWREGERVLIGWIEYEVDRIFIEGVVIWFGVYLN